MYHPLHKDMAITKIGKKFVLLSKTGRRLSKPGSLKSVKRREKQVQFFKNLPRMPKSNIRKVSIRRRNVIPR